MVFSCGLVSATETPVLRKDHPMSADGTWNLTMQTPMGERRSTLTLATSGGSLTGRQEAEGNTTDITDRSGRGNDVSWKVAITNPMPLTLTFSGSVNGNTLNGTADTGMVGSFPFAGPPARPPTAGA